MRQAYYSVNKDMYNTISKDIDRYNLFLKDTFDKRKSKNEKMISFEKKELLSNSISNNLRNHAKLLGFFTENEIRFLEKNIDLLNNDLLNKALNQNCLSEKMIEDILTDLILSSGKQYFSKIEDFLLKAMKDTKNIIVWIGR